MVKPLSEAKPTRTARRPAAKKPTQEETLNIRRLDIASLTKMIRMDQKFKRVKENFNTLPLFQLPLDQFEKEVTRIHKMREVRIMNPKAPNFERSFISAVAHDIAQRSRLAEISLECYRAASLLEETTEALRNYVLHRYSPMISFLKTKSERSDLVDIALAPFLEYQNRAERIQKACDIVITDIDKGGFALKNIVSVMEMQSRGRG